MVARDPAEQVKDLQRAINDLIGLTTLPAMWTGADQSKVVGTLLDVLLGMLGLDFIFLLLTQGNLDIADAVRVAQSLAASLQPDEISGALLGSFGDNVSLWPPEGRVSTGAGDFSVAIVQMGLRGEIGTVIAGSRRPDFASETERLLLNVAANQAALALQQAQLLDAQKRIAVELDQRVADRTVELAQANERLQREIAERSEAEERSRLIVDSIPAGIAIFGPTGHVTGANRQLLEYLGQPLEVMQQWSTAGLIHPQDLPNVLETFGVMIATGVAASFKFRLRRFDGTYRWFEARNMGLRDASGQLVRWHAVITDVDDRERAESAVAASERELRLMLDTLPVGIIVVSPTEGIVSANQQLLNYLGVSLEVLQDWANSEMVHPDQRERTLAYFRTFMSMDGPSSHETHIRRFDGVYRWFVVRNNPLRDADGKIIRWYGLLIDIDDRKRAEDALHESAAQLRLVVNTIPGLVAIFDADGVAEDVNAPFLEYLGQTLEEFRNWATNGTVHPDDVAHHVALLARCFSSGRPIDTETRLRRFDGEYRWFQVRGLPARDAEGRISRWYSLMTDIDDRKKAEEAVAANESSLKTTVDTIPALAWSARPDGTGDFFNKAYLDYVGRRPEELEGWAWTSALHPDDLPRFDAAWQRARESGGGTECEARLLGSDGSYRWFIFRANPLRDSGGAIVKWYGINTDIEDRKRAEEKLAESEAWLAHSQRMSAMGSFAWMLATKEITFFSEELYRIFELDPNVPLTFEQIAARVHPDDTQLFAAKLAQAQAGIVDHDYDVRLRMPDGRVKYIRTESRPDTQADGQTIFVGTMRDITEQKRTEEALNELRTELAHVARVSTLGAMTASIAHEINQPLSGIVTNAGTGLRMLASDPPNVRGAQETARRTLRDAKRATDVISRLRALFTKRETLIEPVELNEAAREVIAFSQKGLQDGRVALQLELADNIPPVEGDRVQLQQVILNLVLNATEAMSEIDDRPRQLVIRTASADQDGVVLAVQDAGPGLDPANVERVFEAFHTTKANGLGIGLSICRTIIEAHGGKLWATSAVPHGAIFQFTLPASGGTSRHAGDA